MKLEFMLDGHPATFERSGMTGRALLRAGDHSVLLQSPWNPFTHIRASTTKTWSARLNAHEVVVVKERARVIGGLREAHFIVHVDGKEVASATGY